MLWEGQGQNKRAVRKWVNLFCFSGSVVHRLSSQLSLSPLSAGRLSLLFQACGPNMAAFEPTCPQFHTPGGRAGQAQLGSGVAPSSVLCAHGVKATGDIECLAQDKDSVMHLLLLQRGVGME